MPISEKTFQSINENWEPAIKACVRSMETINLQYLRERLQYDVTSEFGNVQILFNLWIKEFKGDNVRLIEFYEGIYEDLEVPRHESLIDVFLVSLAATILGGIIVEEYKTYKKHLTKAIIDIQRKCRVSLSYLFDMYALRNMKESQVIDIKEYQVLARRLKNVLLEGKPISRDVQERIKPFYQQFKLSSSFDLIKALEENITLPQKDSSKQKKTKDSIHGSIPKKAISLLGLPVSDGIAIGRVIIMETYRDEKKVEVGDVACVPDYLSPSMVPTLVKCSGAFGFGGMTSHIAVLARGIGIPAVLGLTDLKKVVKEGQYAIVDGSSGKVYLLK